MATVMLGLAPLEHLRVAAAEGAQPYLLGMLATVLGVIVVWFLRRRPLWAVVLLLVWQGAVFWPLRARTTGLGLAFHGEYVLHHFTGLLAAATCVAIGMHWIRRADLGSARVVPGALAVLGTVALLVAHVLEQPSMGGHELPWLEQGGAATLLLAWGTALVLLWPRLHPSRLRWVAVALLLPFVIRVLMAWPEGLAGASVADSGRPVLMVAMVAGTVTALLAFQPSVAPGVRALVMVFSGVATLILFFFYWFHFGNLEADLGGLAQSMFAFSLPYPRYVPAWQVVMVMVGLFAMFSAAYAGLVTPGQRTRGLALALLLVTGLGLSTPPLVLMTGAAALVWIDSLTGVGSDSAVGRGAARPPARPMDELLAEVAERLGLPDVVTLEDAGRSLLAVRGERAETPVDLRARASTRGWWQVTVTVGVLGRGRAPLGLVPEPGDEGHRPAHLLARSHRARGQVRQLELLDDTFFDALVPFPQARVDLWDAGTRVRLGDDLGDLDETTLTTLVEQLVARE